MFIRQWVRCKTNLHGFSDFCLDNKKLEILLLSLRYQILRQGESEVEIGTEIGTLTETAVIVARKAQNLICDV